jgi:hypothetical protein
MAFNLVKKPQFIKRNHELYRNNRMSLMEWNLLK